MENNFPDVPQSVIDHKELLYLHLKKRLAMFGYLLLHVELWKLKN